MHFDERVVKKVRKISKYQPILECALKRVPKITIVKVEIFIQHTCNSNTIYVIMIGIYMTCKT